MVSESEYSSESSFSEPSSSSFSELKDNGDVNVEGIVEEIALKLADPDAEEAAEDVAEGEW